MTSNIPEDFPNRVLGEVIMAAAVAVECRLSNRSANCRFNTRFEVGQHREFRSE